MKRRLIAFVLLVALVGGGIYAYVATRDDDADRVGRTVRVERGDLVEYAGATGTIEPETQVELRSRASGEVLEILVEEGQRVEAGQPLIRLDPTDTERQVAGAESDVRRALAGLREARAALEVAEAEATRSGQTRQLDARGEEMGLVAREAARTSQHQENVAQKQVELRRAQVSAARAALESARLAQADAQRRQEETEIVAPFAGTVLDIAVERGSLVVSAMGNVSGGTPVMTIANLADLRIVGAVDEAQISRIEVGQAVEIRVDAYPGRVFEGRVHRVSPLGAGEAGVVTFDVEIVVTDERAGDLLSGMSADVEIVTRRHEGVLLIPLMSVRSSGEDHLVYLPDGEAVSIEMGPTDGTRLIVTSGLEEGQEIAAEPLVPEAAAGGSSSFLRRRGRRH